MADNNITLLSNYEQHIHQNTNGLALNPDGTLKSPYHQNELIIVFQIIFCCVGIPLDGLSAIAVVRLEELRKKPRHVFFVAIQMCNLFAYFVSLLEIIVYFNIPITSASYEPVCKVYLATAGLPQLCLPATTFLSIVDRYLAISRPLWHRSKVTARLVTIELMVCFILIILINKFVFISQLVPMTCHIHLVERMIMGWSLWILFSLCFVSRIVIYVQNRRLILSSNQSQRQPTSDHRPSVEPQPSNSNRLSNVQHPAAIYNNNQPSASSNKENNCSMAVHLKNRPSSRIISEERTKRMEQESTRSLAAGLTVLILLNLPLMIFTASIHICRLFFSVPSDPKFCYLLAWLVDYFKQLSQIHGVFYPIICWACDREIFEAIKFICSSTNRYRNR